jgi:hypothetical protein
MNDKTEDRFAASRPARHGRCAPIDARSNLVATAKEMTMATDNSSEVLKEMQRNRSLIDEARYKGWKLIARVSVAVIFAFTSVAPAFPKSGPFVPAQGSTGPANGDLNPYGLAVVPHGFPGGALQAGQLLVSNFNNSAADGNVQGEGSTIVTMDPATGHQVGVFFQGTPPIGFTNALVADKAGFVFAGSVFTTNASSPGQNGGLLVIDNSGHLVTTITTGINGPWGLAVSDQGKTAQLFISNVLDGTITRIEVSFLGCPFSKLNPHEFIGGFEGLAITCVHVPARAIHGRLPPCARRVAG